MAIDIAHPIRLPGTQAGSPSPRALFFPLSVAALSLALGVGVATGKTLLILGLAIVALIAAVALTRPGVFGVVLVGALLIPYTWTRGNPDAELLALPGVIAAFSLLLGPAKLRPNVIDYLVVAFLVSIALSGALGGQGLDLGSGSYARNEIEGLVIPYLAFRAVVAAWPRVADKLPGAFIAVGGILSALALWEELQHRALFLVSGLTNPQLSQWAVAYQREGAIRTTATMGQPLAFGTFLILPLLLAFAYRRWRMFALIALGEATTLSRGPWLGAIIALVLFGLLTNRAGRLMLIVTIITVGTLFVGPVHKSVSATFQVGTAEQANAGYRSQLVNASIRSLTVWGHPLPRASELYGRATVREGRVKPTDPASEPINLAAQQGVVGLMVWLGFLIAFAYAIREARRSKDLLLLTLATALVGMWFAMLTVPLVTTFQYAFGLTLALAAARLVNNGPRPPRA